MFIIKNKKNLAAIFGTLAITAGIVGGFSFGLIDKSKPDYDVVITETPINTLNYINGASGTIKKLGASMESLVSSRNDDLRTQEALKKEHWTGEEGVRKHSIITEANKPMEVRELITSEFIPGFTDIKDSMSEDLFNIKVDNNYRLAAAEEIWSNPASDQYRFYLRDTKWSTGNKVKPSDFSFGLMVSANPTSGSATNYTVNDLAMIKGSKEYYEQMSSIAWDIEVMEEAWKEVSYNADSLEPPTKPLEEYGVIYSNKENYFQYQTITPKTQLLSMITWSAFWPIDETFFKQGNYTDVSHYAIDDKTLSVNGGFKVEEWNPGYGISFDVNQGYWAKEGLMIDDFIFRFVEESSTQAAMFKNGDSSHLTALDATTSTIAKQPEVAKYIPDASSAPEAKYLAFNLQDDTDGYEKDIAKFYKNKNFRKAIYFAYDRTIALNLEGKNQSAPTGMYSARGLDLYDIQGSEEYKDYIDIAKDFEYIAHEDSVETTKLNFYNSNDRDEMLKRSSEEINNSSNSNESWYRGEDPRRNIDIARRYFSDFKSDMNELNIAVPSVIELPYVTEHGPQDWVSKAFTESIQEAFNGEVKMKIEYITEANRKPRVRTGQYDTVYNYWSPEYSAPWSIISMNNTSDSSRMSNMSGGWNIWTGSQYSYGDTYQGHTDEYMLNLTGDTGLFGIQDDLTGEKIEFNNLFGLAETKFSNIGTSSFEELIRDFKLVDKDGNILKGDENAPFLITHDPTKENGEISGANIDDIVNLPDGERAKMQMMLEIIAFDGAAIVPISNEYKLANPSRLIFRTEANSIGFPFFTFMYDMDKAPSWAPGTEDILGINNE